MESNLDYYLNILKIQCVRCIENSINCILEILINGKSYSNEYDRNDLILFIEELHENCCLEPTDLKLTILGSR